MDIATKDGVVYAERIASWRRPRAMHESGRVCDAPGCSTILSMYNGSTRCCLHGLAGEHGRGHRVHRPPNTRGTARAA